MAIGSWKKRSVKIDGGEIPSSHQPLSLLKRAQKGVVLEQPANMWQSLSNSCEIFPLLSSWPIAFWASLLKLCTSRSAPYLWHSLDVQEALWDTRNDSAIGTKLQKSCCPSQMNWDPEQKLREPKEFQVKTRWTFYLLIYLKLLYEAHVCEYFKLS